MTYDDELLRPSLAENERVAPLYSVQSMFLVAFFGGPLALGIFGFLNTRRLDRASKDWPFYLGCVAVVAVLIFVGLRHPDLLSAGGDPAAARRNLRYVARGSALALCGILYLLHRQHFRAMSTMGVEHPSPWVPAILSIVAAAVMTFGIGVLAGALVGS